MNRQAWLALLGACALILPFTLPGQGTGDSVEVWLDRMNSAVEELNYRGTFIHITDGHDEMMNIVHRREDGLVRERISPAAGDGREVLRIGNIVRTVIPEKRRVVQEDLKGISTTLSVPLSYSDDLRNYYDIETYPKGSIAGRDTQLIEIRARDEFRYSYKLLLDIETGLPLKAQIRDGTDAVVERIVFTAIEYVDTIADAEFEPVIDTQGFSWVRPIKEQYEADHSELWGVSTLPPGFVLLSAKRSLLAGSEYPVQHLVYTDGLATVSVFVAHPLSEFTMDEGPSSLGSTNAFTLRVNGRLATALGEVPRRTVELIAHSLNAR